MNPLSLDFQILNPVGGFDKFSFKHKILSGINDDDDNDIDGNYDYKLLDEVFKTSSYYDVENLKKVIIDHAHEFTVLSTNIESIYTSVNELKIFIDDLNKNCNFKFSVICLQEGWIPESYDESQLNIPGYKIFSMSQSCGKKGGLVTYVDENYLCSPLNKTKSPHGAIWECMFTSISGNGLNKPVIIGNIYRPPRNDESIFINDLESIIANLDDKKCEVLLLGDYNFDLLKTDTSNYTNEFFSSLSTAGYSPKITLPTRFSDKSASLIDNLFSKISEHSIDSFAGIITKPLSDHLPYFTCFSKFIKSKARKVPPKFVTVTKCPDPERFAARLSEINLLEKFVESDDPNVNANLLMKTLSDINDELSVNKTVKYQKYNHAINPWMTKELLSDIETRDKMYANHLKSPLGSFQRSNLKISARSFSKQIRKSTRLAQINYFNRTFDMYQNDLKKTWSCINDILGKKKAKAALPEFFEVNGEKIYDDQLIAEKFNEFYSSVGHEFANALSFSDDGFKHYIDTIPKCKDTLSFKPVTEKEVSDIITNLKPKSSYGYDGVSSKLIISLKHILLPSLVHLINQCLEQSVFPDALKIAKVIPVYKKDNSKLLSNYRPISLLPAVSKVFEKVMCNRLHEHFLSNNLWYQSQYGYRAKHSTQYAAIEICEKIFQSFQNNDVPLAIFLDLSKAFDTLDHEVLMYKLEHYGVIGNSLALIRSYLSDRKQYVSYENKVSSNLPLTIGVPQGSILGPILFIIYMNDIAQASNIFDFILYADDTSLVTSSVINGKKNSNLVNSELNKISIWLRENRLSLNIGKTKCMLFHHQSKVINSFPKIVLNGNEVDYVNEFKFLGIILDRNLTYKPHTNYICKRILSAIHVLNRLKNILPLRIKITLYNTLVGCHLYNGILLWHDYCNNIYKLQKRTLRCVLCKRYNSAHTEHMFKTTNVLKIQDLVKVSMLSFYHKYTLDALPNYLMRLPLNCNSNLTNYPNTRNRNSVQKTHSHPKSILSHIPNYVKNLPNSIKDKLFHPTFKYGTALLVKQYKLILLDSYSGTEFCVSPECYPCNN